MSNDEFARFSRVLSEHGGRLPITDDQLAASVVRDMVLDMGFDPYWAGDILLTALDMVNQEFDIKDHKAVDLYLSHMKTRREADQRKFAKSVDTLIQETSKDTLSES